MNESEYKPMTVGNWIVTLIILAIPIVNLVMLIVWAVGATTHPSKKSYARANLIFLVVLVVIAIAAALILPAFALLQRH